MSDEKMIINVKTESKTPLMERKKLEKEERFIFIEVFHISKLKLNK